MLISDKATTIIETLQKAGHKTVVVGGAVRDHLLGKEPHDIDIMTTADPAAIKRALVGTAHFTEVGEAFGIVVAVIDGEPFEIATTRADVFEGELDGRHPTRVNMGCSIEADCARRDFTMNQVCFCLDGTFIDPFNGQKDIKNKIIRFVGIAKDRIIEDHLRVLRAFRFQAQLGFDFAPDTFEALIEACRDPHILDGVAMERVTAEMNKILLSDRPAQTLSLMAELGILQIIIPEIQPMIDCQHDTPWHSESWCGWGVTVWSHVLHVIDKCGKKKNRLSTDAERLALMWGSLMHDIGKPRCKKFKLT